MKASGQQRPEFASVYADNYSYVLRVLVRAVRDTELAEDLAQNTFLNAWRSWGRFRKLATARTWLVSIAMNQARNHFRTVKAWRRAAPGGTVFLDHPQGAEAGEAGPRPDIGREGTAEIRVALLQALRRVRPHDRALFVMHHIEGLSEKEMAGRGISAQAAKAATWRARQKLREALSTQPSALSQKAH